MSFDIAVMRHGEAWVQEILDNWERFSGVLSDETRTLEDRWGDFMGGGNKQTTMQ